MRGKGSVDFDLWYCVRITPAYAGKRGSQRQRRGCRKDHPRVCGEKCIRKSGIQFKQGSPPRMRGKEVDTVAETSITGITPAYAGKSIEGICVIHHIWDHPRVCGEKLSLKLKMLLDIGSPPRMRGKVLLSSTPSESSWDHPRVCGEKGLEFSVLMELPGSPPRMRGKASHPKMPLPPLGITPAYAGKRHQYQIRQSCIQDHPRVCGEKFRYRRGSCEYLGSPPRMRGKVDVDVSDRAKVGITPAYAGKRSVSNAQALANRDHPRVCGEKALSTSAPKSVKGSPPRMRGKGLCIRLAGRPRGITPAYAGKRSSPPNGSSAGGDHPRVCGEKRG